MKKKDSGFDPSQGKFKKKFLKKKKNASASFNRCIFLGSLGSVTAYRINTSCCITQGGRVCTTLCNCCCQFCYHVCQLLLAGGLTVACRFSKLLFAGVMTVTVRRANCSCKLCKLLLAVVPNLLSIVPAVACRRYGLCQVLLSVVPAVSGSCANCCC
jgi:hypothetical protein